MTVKSAILESVRTNDAVLAGRVVDGLRFGLGMNYESVCEIFSRIGGISRDEFETLMCEADEVESHG